MTDAAEIDAARAELHDAIRALTAARERVGAAEAALDSLLDANVIPPGATE